MEQASRREIFYQHHNPYTEGLFASLPGRDRSRARLTPIPGSPPSLIGLPPGCPFAGRCPYVFDHCHEETPPLEWVYDEPRHWSACWLPPDLEGRELARGRLTQEEVR
jgi:oligopeptide/dipeptide ABC transporter ATP-binding protein